MQALEKDPTRRFNPSKDFLRNLERSIQVLDAEESSDEDMRWDPRVNMNLQARVQLQDNNELLTAEIIDLSVSGASILIPVSLFVASKLKIEFEILEDENYVSISSQATVLWEKKRTDREMYEIGLSFIDLDDLDKQCLSFYIRNLLLA
jgi:c-di-GMP-binding flagellar brake protein YcgR